MKDDLKSLVPLVVALFCVGLVFCALGLPFAEMVGGVLAFAVCAVIGVVVFKLFEKAGW
jgi:hypothetical protein